jgi:hypothetical protein
MGLRCKDSCYTMSGVCELASGGSDEGEYNTCLMLNLYMLVLPIYR